VLFQIFNCRLRIGIVEFKRDFGFQEIFRHIVVVKVLRELLILTDAFRINILKYAKV